MKKLLAILLTLALILSLAACGGNETPAVDDNAGATGTSGDGSTDGTNDTSGGTSDSTPGGTSDSTPGGTNDGTTGGSQPGTTTGLGYEADRKLNKSGAVSVVDNLNNTYYKLTTEKKLKIGYFGGSVTGGIGGTDGYNWATATTEWFKTKFPSANVESKNIAWGGSGTYWGYFRMGEDNTGKDNIIAYKPDLIFVEFSINDAYSHLTEMQSHYYMEGIIKKLRAVNPKMDIVIVLITDKSKQDGETKNSTAHKAVAAHYGIPTIDVGKALVKEIKDKGAKWEDYVSDIVHPNNKGYKVYADCIAQYLSSKLISSPDKSGYKDHAKPANDLVSNQSTGSYLIKADSITTQTGFTAINSNSVNCPSLGGKKMFGKQGSKMTVEFEGRGFGILCDGGNGGKIKVTVDGKSVTIDVMGGNNFEYPAIENLKPGKRTAEIEIISGSRVAIGAFAVEK